MRRSLLLLLAGLALSAGSFSCSGGVDTKTPPPGDDDDDAATTGTPTPTGTVTPGPTGLQGDPWTATATPASDVCSLVFEVTFGNAGVAAIGIGTTGSDIYFDIGLHLNPAIGIGDEPAGTVDMAGNFTQTFSYCTFNGLSTYKYYGNWTGTFSGDGLTFDSTLGERLFVANGDFLTTCASAIDTAGGFNFGDCSSPGTIQFAVHGVKQ